MSPETRSGPEKVVLVGVGLRSDGDAIPASLAELRGLAATAGAQVVAELSQALRRFSPGTLIGSGKIEEIAAAVDRLGASTVIFDMELSPSQQKRLEAGLRAKIIDRTRLILDIFARRARTSEGRLQVELAQLSYLLPRLTGSWRAYSQQVGGIGTRGPGERQLEYERRHISRRILYLRKELARIKEGRELRRRRRLEIPVPQIALVGYTNVGKSTLLNALARDPEAVYADDKLFATLDPTSRRVRLPEGGWAVMTDTVGFISRLPTPLVAAFHATLEEAALADCLLVVSDASAPHRERQRDAVDSVLRELGAEAVPRVDLLNKADRLSPAQRAELARARPEAVLASARTGEGLAEALERAQALLGRRWRLEELDLPSESRRHLPTIYRCAQVLSQTHTEGGTRLRLRVTAENWRRLRSLIP